jgi:sortase A
MRAKLQTLLSIILVAAGVFLLLMGSREYLDSRLGQSEAARDFEQPVPNTPETRSATEPAVVHPVKLGDTVAKLSIPRLDAELYVVEGDDAKELRRGPGHLAGTAMPGANGNCVIAGHRDTHFRVLKDIREGDDIVLQTSSGQYLYRVKRMRVVMPDNTSALQPTSTPELNLITCYPFYYVGSAPKRFVVEAQLAGAVQRPS